tara:strand:+ start:5673 stop:6758 length:1086 start_codon:yes stop_codon:yes gene_type:complete
MNKINFYLFGLSLKYIIFNLIILTTFILFINLIELSRTLQNNENTNTLINYLYLSYLKIPSIMNEIIPFVIIISMSFLFRNLINNNELISMRNIGYSIFDIFFPISLSVFTIGIFFLFILNPISVNFDNKFEKILNKKDNLLYSINITEKEMWIKNKINESDSSIINIKNIDLKNMIAENIKIIHINKNQYKFITAKIGKIEKNKFILSQVMNYNIKNDKYNSQEYLELDINFNKENIINSISNYKLIPFYKYLSHSNTLKKFNLYSPEIGLFYFSEILKPIFIVMLSFVVIGFSGKFKRNENFFKVLFISILIGFLIFFLKEIITKITISLSVNFYISYLIIFFLPFSIGLYQVIKIEND